MANFTITAEKLRDLIGLRVTYDGETCRVIEIIEEQLALVLEFEERDMTIQSDQHGGAHRRVPATTVIPVLHVSGADFDNRFLSLDLIDEP